MKKQISIILTMFLLFNLTVFAEGESSSKYSDFDISKYPFVDKYNIVNGYDDGTFRPEINITRAEFLKILMGERAISKELSENTPNEDINFSDVNSTHWAYDEIKAAVNAGIVNGYEDGTFRPDDNITYEQGIKMTLSMLGYAPLAEMYGGYPTGYMAIGYNTRFFKADGSTLDWENCSVENMNEEKQKSYMTRRDVVAFAERAFLTPICYVLRTDTNWDGSHSVAVSIGGEDTVVKTIYSTSGAVTVVEENN
jgi:hypothetical protein